MKSDDTPMYDDPNESAFVRELLQAGRRATVEYDVERGLAKHLATIASGVAPQAAAAGAAKSGLTTWLGYLALPLAAVGVAASLWMLSEEPRADRSRSQADPVALETDSRGSFDSFDKAPIPSSSESEELEVDAPSQAVSARPQRARPERRSSRPVARPANASRVTAANEAAPSRASEPELPVESARVAPAPVPDLAVNPYVSSAPGTGEPSTASDVEPSFSDRGEAPAQPSVASETEPAPDTARDERAVPRSASEDDAVHPARESSAAREEPARPVIDDARLEREMQMLAVTQRVLESDPERALRLAQQGEREFPGTMFSAERRQLELLALVKLGRLEEARREGRPFLARYPKAPWSERLRRALATGRIE